MSIKWYKDGKLSDPEPDPDQKFYIFKYVYNDGYSYNGCRFWLGKFEEKQDKIFFRVFRVKKDGMEESGIYPIKYNQSIEVPYTDSIQVKLGKIWITSDHTTGSVYLTKWKYDELVKILGEENIDFYRGED